jgi:hypothetical protein
MDRPDLIDTVRSKPDMVTAHASLARLELVAQTGALDLAVDTAETIKARNSLEKMLGSSIAWPTEPKLFADGLSLPHQRFQLDVGFALLSIPASARIGRGTRGTTREPRVPWFHRGTAA